MALTLKLQALWKEKEGLAAKFSSTVERLANVSEEVRISMPSLHR